ncbi:phytanoyl-CoA dioxygenase family protein [Quadrisphaera sp. DSM 44207]|uniref:phytanoyl-CoA dioxygenase family protein n=1 Tax=Quadrisphaera sp. DSM 44207 TaxID=1881057 RepID=UPI000885AF7D|nr:phytanoyl-CoA dioxygenase family protein [Quadrisphaera sp. DSM 44207]SDQ66985.1 Phytanoyl-CoA dioxygenase (PhyH) [Quadrisphaera sp. DSM 44207]
MVRQQVAQYLKRENPLTWRWVFNAGPTLEHAKDPAPLSPAGARAVEELRANGAAMTTVRDLMGSDECFQRILDQADRLIADGAERIAERRARMVSGDHEAKVKPFVVELLRERPQPPAQNAVLALASAPAFKGVAEHYLRMRLAVRDTDIWLNLRTDGEAAYSQRWHRDMPQDHRIVKAFVFLRDVTPGNGPTQVVLGTHRAQGRRLDVGTTEFDGFGHRIPDEEVDTRLAGWERFVATGTAGSVLFADTRSIHRGGLASTDDRLLAQVQYATRSWG